MNKFKQWSDMAKKFHGNDFWSSIFDQSKFNPNTPFADMMQADPDYPRVDISKSEAEVIILIELPGVSKQNIELAIEGANLRIRGHVPDLNHGLNKELAERYTGAFDRLIPLSEPTNRRAVQTKFEGGLLVVKYPRNYRTPMNETIDIQE